MSKTLYLPEHVAQKMNKERQESKADSSALDSAYVDANERVLDPSLLDKPLLERLPQPTGWRVLVMPYEGQAKTSSGLYIPDEVRERERVATVVAYVMWKRILTPGGGTGRRATLRALWPKGRAGSTPALGTKHRSLDG